MQKLEKVLLAIIFMGICLLLLTPFVVAPVLYSYSFDKTIFFQSIISLIFPLWITLIFINSKYRPTLNLITKSILLFLFIIFISALFGFDFSKSFWGSDDRMTGIFTFIHFFIFYLILISFFEKESYKNFILIFILATSLVMSVIGLFQNINSSGQFLNINVRVFSLIGNPIAFASYLLPHIFLSFYLLYKYKNKIIKILFLILGLFESFILFLTFTRGAYIAFALGVGIVLLLLFINYYFKNKNIIKVSLLIIFAVFILSSFFANQILSIVGIEPSGTIQTRLMLWDLAKKAFFEYPILGWGHDNFDLVFDKYYNPEFLNFTYYETWSNRAHNLVFDLLSNTGILGLFSYLLIFFSAFWIILKKKIETKEIILIGLFISYFIQSLFAFDSTSSLLIFFILLAYVYSEYGENKNTDNYKKINILFIPVCFIIAFLSLVFFNIRPAIASYYALNSRVVFDTNYVVGEEYFKKSINIFTPYRNLTRIKFANNVYRLAMADILEKEEKNRLVLFAVDEVNKSKKSHPNIFSYPFLLGNLYASIGKFEEAYDEFEDALKLSPKRQVIYFQYASAKFLEGDRGGAQALLKEALELDNNVGEVHWRYGLSLIGEDDELAIREAIIGIEKGYSPYSANEEIRMNEISSFATIFIEDKNWSELVSFYELLVQFNIESADIYAQLAVAYFELGDFSNAKIMALKAVEIDPSFEQEAKEFIKMLEK